MNIPFRNDDYGKNFYTEDENGFSLIPYKLGSYSFGDINLTVDESTFDDVLKISVCVSSTKNLRLKRLGFRLGIDSYMESYPEWNEKFFPTALRCENNGFWSCFMSPLGKMVSVCSPSKIVSWKNEYNDLPDDVVGHRIYTSSIELINTYKNPKRHPESPTSLDSNPISFELYYAMPQTETELFDFISKYANIHIPSVNKFTLEQGEQLLIDSEPFNQELKDGLNTIALGPFAETSVFVRKNWDYYLECAANSALKCQQKPGTHCESWYGFFSLVAFAKVKNDLDLTNKVVGLFEDIFKKLTEKVNGEYVMRKETIPLRVQNISSMVSLLCDMWELTDDSDYLNRANSLAKSIIALQSPDGAYRRNGTHYTCVIYPAKSMLELAIAEKKADLTDRYNLHFSSAYKAIKDLETRLDNIATEGQMTFEDGMISCEALQLAFLALQLPDCQEKTALTNAAEYLLNKHRCLEQVFIPDCKTRGCTLRFWEARYDLNFFSNMLNTPHGWTSWKNYATYYLYLLTGKREYLKDTMDTLGACMQCVDKDGVLNWGFVVDPCIVAERISKVSKKGDIKTEIVTVGECYMPMVSDWWRQDEDKLILQFLYPHNDQTKWDELYGGSCDNDVHEHFKCLFETVFGKAFIHKDEDEILTYNCFSCGDGYTTRDKYVTEWIIYSKDLSEIKIDGKVYPLSKGFNNIKA